MNCPSFESIVSELARQQMMEANVRDMALRHADECDACSAQLVDERALTQSLRAVATQMSGVEAPARIEQELLAAFRQNKFTQPKRSANYAWRYWATAVAAVLLIVIGIGAMSMRSRLSPVAGENHYIPTFQANIAASVKGVVEPPAGSNISGPELNAPESTLSSVYPGRPGNSSLNRPNSSRSERNVLTANSASTVAANYGGNEIATDFIPVGYTSPMNLEDGGQVMRVELPRSTLAGFGLPVNMERVNERVKADVLVGPDGQARAIRFVQ